MCNEIGCYYEYIFGKCASCKIILNRKGLNYNLIMGIVMKMYNVGMIDQGSTVFNLGNAKGSCIYVFIYIKRKMFLSCRKTMKWLIALGLKDLA